MAEKQKKKAFWKSKTFWFNVISASVVGASMAAESNPEAQAVKAAAPYVITIGNLLLRGMTKKPVGIKDE